MDFCKKSILSKRGAKGKKKQGKFLLSKNSIVKKNDFTNKSALVKIGKL
jgi:hypothetical protein